MKRLNNNNNKISLRLKIQSKVLLIIVCNFRDRLMNQRRAIDDATKVDGLEMVKEDIKVVEKDRMGGSQVKKINNATGHSRPIRHRSKDNNGGYRNNLSGKLDNGGQGNWQNKTKQKVPRKLAKQSWWPQGNALQQHNKNLTTSVKR